MGLFGSIGKAAKGINWDRVSTGFSAAGAAAHGDHGQAGQIWNQYRQGRKEKESEAAEQQQRAQLVAAAVQMGVPAAEAGSLPTSALAGLVAQQYQPKAPSEFDRALERGGIDPNSPQGRQLYAQRASTMASPAPQMIGSPETGYQWVTPPAAPMPSAAPPSGGPQPGAVISGYRFKGGNPNDRNSWEPVQGGAGGNTGGTFRFGGQTTRF